MRKIPLVVSMLTCLIMFIIAGFLHVGECAEYEPDTDRPGSDYSSYDLEIPDWTFCKSSCDSGQKCIAWTYVKPNTIQGPKARCWLKNSLQAKKANTCCISGVKPCPPISVSSPVSGKTYFVNQPCVITWDTSNIKNYGTVFLSVVQYDLGHLEGWEGGGFPVSNTTGNYQWKIPANVGPTGPNDWTNYGIKIVTPDHRCEGQSGRFDIKTDIKNLHLMEKMIK